MALLNSWEIDDMRSVVQLSLSDVCDIHRRTAASDAWGGAAATGSTIASAVPCYLSPYTGQDQQIAGRVLGRQEYMLSLPHDQDIRTGDYVTVTGKGQFEVQATIGPESEDLYTHVIVGRTEDSADE